MAPGDGSLRSEGLVGDVPESGKRGSAAQNYSKIRGPRVGNSGGSAGTDAECFMRTADVAYKGNPREASGAFETAMIKTL